MQRFPQPFFSVRFPDKTLTILLKNLRYSKKSYAFVTRGREKMYLNKKKTINKIKFVCIPFLFEEQTMLSKYLL